MGKLETLSEKQAAYRNALIRRIHTSARWLDFFSSNKDVYKSTLMAAFGVDSSAKLSLDQLILFEQYMNDGLTVNAFWQKAKSIKPKRRKSLENVIELPTGKQVWFFEYLKNKITWRESDGCERWCLKYFGFRHPKTKMQYHKAISGLQRML